MLPVFTKNQKWQDNRFFSLIYSLLNTQTNKIIFVQRIMEENIENILKFQKKFEKNSFINNYGLHDFRT